MTDQLNDIENTQAKLGGLGRTRVFDLIRSGELASVKIGRRRFVPDSAIQRYIDSLKASA
jgi:excisionase family DNA binding protein